MIDNRNKAKGFFHWVAAEKDILTDGSRRNRLEFLMHHGNTFLQCIHRILDLNGLPINQDLPFIHFIDTEHALHQCALARSIFPH